MTAGRCEQLAWYIIYLTNWNVILNTISSLFMAIVQTSFHRQLFRIADCDNDKVNLGISRILKTQWALWILSLVVSVSLSLVYWPLIYTGKDKGLNDALTHAGNAIVNVVDLFVVAFPARFGLFVWPLSLGTVYALGFSLPYALAGGKNRHGFHYIYNVTDWLEKPGGALIFTVSTLTFLTIMHCVLTCLMILREKIHKRMIDRKKNEIVQKNQHQMENHDNPTFTAWAEVVIFYYVQIQNNRE